MERTGKEHLDQSDFEFQNENDIRNKRILEEAKVHYRWNTRSSLLRNLQSVLFQVGGSMGALICAYIHGQNQMQQEEDGYKFEILKLKAPYMCFLVYSGGLGIATIFVVAFILNAQAP